MKRHLLLGALLLGSISMMNAQQTLFEDNFDSYDDFIIANIGEWTQIDVDGSPTYGIELEDETTVEFENSGYTGTAIIFNQSATNPALDSWTPVSGAKSLNFFAAQEPVNDDWFITPRITMATTGNKVTFQARSITDAFGLEKMAIAVSTTGNTDPADFTVISTGTSIDVPVEWTEFSFPLDTYAGQDIYIAIHYVSDDSFALLVDDFSVTADGVAGINDVLASKLTVFPNPVNNVITISSAENILLNGVQIADLNGRIVKSTQYNNISNTEVNVSDLASGVYMMTISSDKGTATKKIVKN